MDLLELIIEYHKGNERQGRSSEEATLKALSCIPDLNKKPEYWMLAAEPEVRL